jgi:hypothetical protein
MQMLGSVLLADLKVRPPSHAEISPLPLRDWEAAVGSRIAARARPLRLDRGTLYVKAATATWAQELSLLADAIIKQLRGRGLDVSALRFRVGPIDAIERPARDDAARIEPRAAPLPHEVAIELAKIQDADLRTAIARAASKNLGWQEARAIAAERAAISARPTVRALRSAEPESAPPARTLPPPPSDRRGKP